MANGMTQPYGMGSPIIRPLGMTAQNIMATPIGGTTPQVSTVMTNPMITPQVSTVMTNPMITPQVSTVMPNITDMTNQQIVTENVNGIGQTVIDRYSTTRPLSVFYSILNSSTDLTNLLPTPEFYRSSLSQTQTQGQTLTGNDQIPFVGTTDNFVTPINQNSNQTRLNVTDSDNMVSNESNQFIGDNFTDILSSQFQQGVQQNVAITQSNVISNVLNTPNIVNQLNKFHSSNSSTITSVQLERPVVSSTNRFYNSTSAISSTVPNLGLQTIGAQNRFYSSRS